MIDQGLCMNRGNNNATIDNLRALALTLDMRLGVEARKQILAGNEKITLATNEQQWIDWMSGVKSRMKMIAGSQIAGEVLANQWWSSPTQIKSEE